MRSIRVVPVRSLALRGEKAVAQPAGSFPRRAIHEDVQRVLPEREDASGKQTFEPLVAARELSLPNRRMCTLAQINAADLARAFLANQFQVAKGVRLQRLNLVVARLQFVTDGVHATEAFEVNVRAGQDFVKDKGQPRPLGAGHLGTEKAGQVSSQIQNVVGVLFEFDLVLRTVRLVERGRLRRRSGAAVRSRARRPVRFPGIPSISARR